VRDTNEMACWTLACRQCRVVPSSRPSCRRRRRSKEERRINLWLVSSFASFCQSASSFSSRDGVALTWVAAGVGGISLFQCLEEREASGRQLGWLSCLGRHESQASKQIT